MKFNSYLVELESKDAALTGTIEFNDGKIHVNLKRISQSLYVAHFKIQVELKFQQQLLLINRNKQITILLPLLSKYNKRKLNKLTKLLDQSNGLEKTRMLLNILQIEKFLNTTKLLHFFSMEKGEALDFIIRMEIDKKAKLIECHSLTIISYQNYLNYGEQLNELVENYYRNQEKTLKISEIETGLKLPRTAIFFRYLLRSIRDSYSLKISKDKIIFQKVAISDKDRQIMTEISRQLRKNKLTVFTLENVLELGDWIYKEVNDALWFLLEDNQIVQLNEEYFIFSDELNKILNRMKKHKRNQDENIDIQSFREMTLLNRKKLIVLFEYFDSQRITARIGNKRKILLGV